MCLEKQSSKNNILSLSSEFCFMSGISSHRSLSKNNVGPTCNSNFYYYEKMSRKVVSLTHRMITMWTCWFLDGRIRLIVSLKYLKDFTSIKGFYECHGFFSWVRCKKKDK